MENQGFLTTITKDKKKWTFPNLLTVTRMMVFAPLILYLMLDDKMAQAGYLYVIAAITDWLDGKIARGWKQQSETGELLDPIADKLLVLLPLIVLIQHGVWWWLVALIFIREIGVTLGRMYINGKPELKPAAKVTYLGKLKATFQYAAIILVIFGFSYPNAIMSVAAFFTVWSGIDYLIIFWRLFKKVAFSS